MSTLILRRRKLGRSSVRGLVSHMETTPTVSIRNDLLERRLAGTSRKAPPQRPDWLIRWGCTSSLPEEWSPAVLNTSRAIHEVNNKRDFRMKLQEEGEELVPRTYVNGYNFNHNYDTSAVIVRPTHHHQGRRLWVCQTQQATLRALDRCTEGYYISELINKAAEYRVFVVQGRVASVARKTPGNPDDVAWNVSQGGRFDNVRFDDWPLQAVRKSVEAFNLSELDFGGVDVMVDGDGRAYIIEINSAPSLPMNEDGSPTYRQLCMAKCFDYIVRHNSKARIPLVDDRGGYLKFIHPAINDRARLV